MRTFFRFIRNIFLLALLAFGVWTYKNNPDFQIATNDSLVTLSYRINQLLTMGTATAPKNGINSNTKTNTDKTENDNSSETRIIKKDSVLFKKCPYLPTSCDFSMQMQRADIM